MPDDADWVAICPCTGITVAQAKKAIAEGARTTEEVFERVGEIVYCSRCMVDIDDMIFATRK
jgi:bacterioferritin-associated ferredoxin